MRSFIVMSMAGILLGCRPQATVVTLEAPRAPGADQADPALASDPASGDLLMTWAAGDSAGYAIWFARSSDGGGTWSAPVTVAGPARDIRPHGESAARLVAARGVLAVVWSNSITVPGRQWPASNIRFARSTDGGQTWSAAITLNDDSAAAPAGHLFHGAAWEGDSTIVVSWLDERRPETAAPGHRGTDASARGAGEAPVVSHEHAQADAEPDAHIYLARSADLGATWTRRNEALWGTVCPCCRVALARGPDGRVSAAWRKHYPGNVRDIVVAPLGAEEPRRVHEDAWVYPGCPHTGPGLAADSAGRQHVAWFVGKQGSAGVYYARQDAGAAGYSAPLALAGARTMPTAHASVAAGSRGAFVAWDMSAEGRRLPLVAIIDERGQVRQTLVLDQTEGADHPQVVGLRDGRAVVAWTVTGERSRVRLARVARGR